MLSFGQKPLNFYFILFFGIEKEFYRGEEKELQKATQFVTSA